MNTYEGMFIFPDSFGEEEIDGIVKEVRAEIERHGGELVSSTRLGRRTFARPLKKSDRGHYAVLIFTIPGDQLKLLHNRFKLNESVLRVQFVKAQAPEAVAE